MKNGKGLISSFSCDYEGVLNKVESEVPSNIIPPDFPLI